MNAGPHLLPLPPAGLCPRRLGDSRAERYLGMPPASSPSHCPRPAGHMGALSLRFCPCLSVCPCPSVRDSPSVSCLMLSAPLSLPIALPGSLCLTLSASLSSVESPCPSPLVSPGPFLSPTLPSERLSSPCRSPVCQPVPTASSCSQARTTLCSPGADGRRPQAQSGGQIRPVGVGAQQGNWKLFPRVWPGSCPHLPPPPPPALTCRLGSLWGFSAKSLGLQRA